MMRVKLERKWVDPMRVLKPRVLLLTEIQLRRDSAESEEESQDWQEMYYLLRDELIKTESEYRPWINLQFPPRWR